MANGNVLILGAGVAGATTAWLLQRAGYAITCIDGGARYDALEAAPVAILRLFDAVGLSHVAAEVSRPVRGFGGGDFLIYSRAALVAALRRSAAAVGVAFVPKRNFVPGVPSIDFRIDASGRTAAWSRPLQRFNIGVADVFRAPTRRPGAQFIDAGDHWAYLLDDGQTRTIGVVGPRRARSKCLPPNWAEAFAMPPAEASLTARCLASAQWTTRPVDGRRLSVGDAAFAHEPLAGQGIRFALACALAATATVRTLLERPEQADAARTYYADLVAAERDHHLSYLRGDVFDAPATNPGAYGHDLIRFVGEWKSTPMVVAGFIEAHPALHLPDGRTTRWVGGVDTKILADVADRATTVAMAQRRLQDRGLSSAAARALISWGIAQGVLSHHLA